MLSQGPSETEVIELPTQPQRVLKLDLTRDPNDIWDRIRRGFGMQDLDTNLVMEWQTFYLARPSFLKSVFERGGKYLYYFVDELEQRGMPTELALLPMVESSYNPLAKSPSQASGLWQFIPSTGRNFNLVQDSWIDERRDVIASTNAALDYLEYLYEMHGDWQLAVTSYNWGEGAVARAVKRNQAEGLPTDYRSLRMPDQPTNYLPKLQALKNIVASPELFGIELPYLSNEQHFTTVQVPRGLDVKAAARLADMPLEEFVALNPAYNRGVVNRTNAHLVIPTDRADTFKLRLSQAGDEVLKTPAQMAASNTAAPRPGSGQSLKPPAANRSQGAQARSNTVRAYRVQKGDTLYSIARKHKLTLKQLLDANQLNSKSILRAGQTLVIPQL